MIAPSVTRAAGTCQIWILMNLHVEVAPQILLHALTLNGVHAEERQFAVCLAVVQPTPEKLIAAVDPEAGGGPHGQDTLPVVAEGVVDIFIGSEESHSRRLDLAIARYLFGFFGKRPLQLKAIQSVIPRCAISFEESGDPDSITTIFAKRPMRSRQVPRFRSSLRIGTTSVTRRSTTSVTTATIRSVSSI